MLRRFAGHDTDEVSEGVASASHIRELVLKGQLDGLSGLMPESSLYGLLREMSEGRAPARLSKGEAAVLLGLRKMTKERLLEILLAHELFHAVEEQYAGEIFTRTEKIELWRKPFSNRSVISCLSEIAAMAFARQLSGLSVSPYMLDVLLVYSYDKNTSYGLYDEIWKWNREVLSDKNQEEKRC